MRRLLLGCVLAAAASLVGCMPRDDRAAQPPDGHNSRNALDWPGTYEGVLPCADCPGIKTRLVLFANGRYELSTQYLDRQSAPQTASGRFSWNSAGSTITLASDGVGVGQQFQVGEGRLLQFNQDGSSPGWTASHRLLTKQDPK